MNIAQFVNEVEQSPPLLLLSLLLLFLSSIVTLSNGLQVCANYYRNTFGHKSFLLKQLAQLAADTNIGYFRGLLGEPVFINSNKGRSEFIFVNKLFYVQALTAANDGRVVAYSVTTRWKSFNPTITLGPWEINKSAMRIKLGKSTFAEVDRIGSWRPSITLNIGAHTYGYYEKWYFGNPGHYLTYVFSINQTGYVPRKLSLRPILPSQNVIDPEDPGVRAFRQRAIINTYTVTSVSGNDLGFSYGPSYNQIRILPESQ